MVEHSVEGCPTTEAEARAYIWGIYEEDALCMNPHLDKIHVQMSAQSLYGMRDL